MLLQYIANVDHLLHSFYDCKINIFFFKMVVIWHKILRVVVPIKNV